MVDNYVPTTDENNPHGDDVNANKFELKTRVNVTHALGLKL